MTTRVGAGTPSAGRYACMVEDLSGQANVLTLLAFALVVTAVGLVSAAVAVRMRR